MLFSWRFYLNRRFSSSPQHNRQRVKELFLEIAAHFGFEIEECEVAEDHTSLNQILDEVIPWIEKQIKLGGI